MNRKYIISFLAFCSCLILGGRAYQYLFWDAPFRAFLWDEDLLSPIVEGVFNTSWHDYVTNLNVDTWIQRLIELNGFLFLLAAISSVLIARSNRWFYRMSIYTGGVLLFILALLLYKEKFFHNAQLIEHSIQFGVPFVLLYAVKENANFSKVKVVLKILIALTFVGHGLYALGFYPIPGNFVDMTIRSLNVSEDFAVNMLYIAGVLDLILAVGIFLPKVDKYFLLYAAFWGLATAFARIVANFNIDYYADALHQYIYQVVYRLPHGLIPLLAYLMSNNWMNKD